MQRDAKVCQSCGGWYHQYCDAHNGRVAQVTNENHVAHCRV